MNQTDAAGNRTGPWQEPDPHGGTVAGEYVAGLREGGWIRREHGGQLRLGGTAPMTLFRAGQEPAEYAPGADLAFLLQGATPSGSHRAIG